VFFGIKYPDEKLFAAHPNVCGYTVNPDFDIILREANSRNNMAGCLILCVIYLHVIIGIIFLKDFPFLLKILQSLVATQNVGLTNGVFGAYDCDAYTSAMQAAQRASSVLVRNYYADSK